MTVGIGPHFSWLHTQSRPGRSYFVPYLVVLLQKEFLNSNRADHAYCKHHLRVNSDIRYNAKKVALCLRRFATSSLVVMIHELVASSMRYLPITLIKLVRLLI